MPRSNKLPDIFSFVHFTKKNTIKAKYHLSSVRRNNSRRTSSAAPNNHSSLSRSSRRNSSNNRDILCPTRTRTRGRTENRKTTRTAGIRTSTGSGSTSSTGTRTRTASGTTKTATTTRPMAGSRWEGNSLSTRASLTLLHLGFVSRSSFFLVFERDRAFFSPINSCLRIEFKFRGKIFCPFLFSRPPA